MGFLPPETRSSLTGVIEERIDTATKRQLKLRVSMTTAKNALHIGFFDETLIGTRYEVTLEGRLIMLTPVKTGGLSLHSRGVVAGVIQGMINAPVDKSHPMKPFGTTDIMALTDRHGVIVFELPPVDQRPPARVVKRGKNKPKQGTSQTDFEVRLLSMKHQLNQWTADGKIHMGIDSSGNIVISMLKEITTTEMVQI